MREIIIFAILGAGAGAAYALTGLGIVLIYKGSGAINFAQGAIAMFAAFCYSALVQLGLPAWLAALATLAGAALAGVALYAVIMRPLRHASSLAQAIASLGILVTLVALAVFFWNNELQQGVVAPSILPQGTVDIFNTTIGVDRLCLLGITIGLLLVLWPMYRYTTYGLATRAVAENELGLSLLGYSPDRVAALNWAAGCALAALAGVLISPLSALNITALTFLVLPALAAALCGRFVRFGVTALAGIAIGIVQSLATQYSNTQGIASVIPLIVIILAILITGRRIPQRGTLSVGRPPFATDGRVRVAWVFILPVAVIGSLLVATKSYDLAITTSLIGTIFALSLVVVTGFVGQINLAPLSFAAMGAFGVSILGHNLQLPFPLPLLLAALVAIPVGVAIGLPALRIRGINLAVVTLGIGVAMDDAVFQNYAVSGGQQGRPIPSPQFFGLSLDAAAHPVSFGLFTLVVVSALALMVSSVRRSSLGRRMLAVRGNERAAAACGINVATVKLVAFGMSAFIAAVGGGLLGYQFKATTAGEFTTELSLAAVALAFIGGISSVGGAFQAGLLTSGGVLFVAVNQLGDLSKYYAIATGLLLIVTVVTQPDGIAVQNARAKTAVMSWIGSKMPSAAPDQGLRMSHLANSTNQKSDSEASNGLDEVLAMKNGDDQR